VSQYWYDRGGTEVLARHLASALERLGNDVALVYLDVANRPTVDRPGMPGTVVAGAAWKDAMQALATWGAEEVVFLLDLRNALTEPISRLECPFRRTIYVNINNAEGQALRAAPSMAAHLRETILRFDRVAVFFEGSVASGVLAEWGVPYRVAGTGIPPVDHRGTTDFRRRHQIAPSETVLLCVGLIAPLKCQVEMLQYLQERPGQRVVFVGDIYTGTPDYGIAFGDAVLARTDCLWLDGLPRHEVLEAMAASDLLLFPSQSEGAPLVLLESMAMGLPWVTTPAIDFARELQGGVIIPLQGFQPAVDALMQAPAYRAELARDGQTAQAARWNLDVTAATFAAWFAEVATGAHEPERTSAPATLVLLDLPWGDVVDGDEMMARTAALTANGMATTWIGIVDGPTTLTGAARSQFDELSSYDHDAIILFRDPAPEPATATLIAQWIASGVVAFFMRSSWYRGQPALAPGVQSRGLWMANMVAQLSASGSCYLGEADR
jgi:glycosyltransferase involved in cell wall biosynthesis